EMTPEPEACTSRTHLMHLLFRVGPEPYAAQTMSWATQLNQSSGNVVLLAVVLVPKEERSMVSEKPRRKWSANVTETSDALDLEEGIFKAHSARRITASVKLSAEHSRHRKAGSFQSALSMLEFYINRAGKNLPSSRQKVLEAAKSELRRYSVAV